MNGIPCSRAGLAGLTGVFLNLGPPTSWTFEMQMACVTADTNELNNTRGTASDVTLSFPPNQTVERTLYPAGDEDWYLMPLSPFRAGTSVSQAKTGVDSVFNAPIHIEIYEDGALAASGDGQASFFAGTGHTWEVHVSGPGPALYRIS